MAASASTSSSWGAEAELSQQVVGKEPCPIRITVLQFQLHSSSCHDMPSFVMGASSLLSVGPTSVCICAFLLRSRELPLLWVRVQVLLRQGVPRPSFHNQLLDRSLAQYELQFTHFNCIHHLAMPCHHSLWELHPCCVGPTDCLYVCIPA